MKNKKDTKTEEVKLEENNELTVTKTSPQSVVVNPDDLRSYIEHEKQLREILNNYITSELKLGIDFGTIKIKSRDGKEYKSKPSLFKPGSEKFCAIMHLRPTFKRDDDTWDMSGNQQGLFCYVCELVNERGVVVGEGRGAASIDEKANWTANNAIKLAQKRAQVDAVIRTGQLSDFFTQDLEDMNFSTGQSEDEMRIEKVTQKAKYGATGSLTNAQKAFQEHYRKLGSIKTEVDKDEFCQAVVDDEKLTDKQKSYLKDLAIKSYEQNSNSDLPF